MKRGRCHRLPEWGRLGGGEWKVGSGQDLPKEPLQQAKMLKGHAGSGTEPDSGTDVGANVISYVQFVNCLEHTNGGLGGVAER